MGERVWEKPWQSCFERVFDVAVVGTGYAGYAAARAAEAQGRSVLLLDRGAELLWESGRAMASQSDACDHELWRDLIDELRSRDAASDTAAQGVEAVEIDGPAAEVIASHRLLAGDVHVLYYAAPVAAELDDEQLVGLILATKSGARRVVARQWIDATETGELITLIEHRTGRSTPRRAPARQHVYLGIQHHQWADDLPEQLAAPTAAPVSLAGGTLTVHRSMWENQRVLRVELPGDHAGWNDWPGTIITALRALHEAAPEAMRQSVVSHMSVVPLAIYEASEDGPPSASASASPAPAPAPAASNVVAASPSVCPGRVETLADRFELGLAAAARLGEKAGAAFADDGAAALGRAMPTIEPARRMEAEVVVAGAGTGGAMAAIAAGRQGSRVICVEPMAFPGGIGAGGGIHNYYFGIPGGLQAELDQRVKDLMDLFGSVSQVRGFHPEAKKLVLLQMMREAGVTYLPHTTVFATDTRDRRVTGALAAGPEGAIQLRAKGWVDATGDGDLCALAGAAFNKGRTADGRMHAYSQSAGMVGLREHQGRTYVTTSGRNYDAGYVDPTDSEDLTRGRLVGICQYMRDQYDAWSRMTYIAPAVGLRQGRQVRTRYMLTLADLIERRHFSDVIGFTGSHYDNHAVDYEFESDEAMFWVWLCRQWRTPIASEMPYRMLLPEALDNVWVGSRALGVTQDAHACCRMQRDMQRAGEAAGLAAALAAQQGVDSGEVPIETLQQKLTETNAISIDRVRTDGPWGTQTVDLAMLAEPTVDREAIERGLECLAQGIPDATLWHLYRHPDEVGGAGGAVRRHLDSDDPRVSWLAAGVLAMWGDAAAEPRLLEAIRTREYGYDEHTDRHMNARKGSEGPRPEQHSFLAPNWLAALSLLRCCGTERAWPALLELAREPRLVLNVRTGIAVTAERLVRAGRGDATVVPQLIDALLADEAAGSVVGPRHCIGRILQEKVEGVEAEVAAALSPRPEVVVTPHHSLLWQLHLVVARLCRRTGTPLPTIIEAYRHDHRRNVREAFAAALGGAESADQAEPATAAAGSGSVSA